MLQVANQTPFRAVLAAFPNAQGIDTVYAAITATFQLGPRPALSEEQLQPVLSDTYYGDPASSSMRYPGELHLGKPTTDVIVVGHARAPEERPLAELGVGVRVAERTKVARVIGDRVWAGTTSTRPRPFVEMPLVYERAFGGVVEQRDGPTVAEERNPLGKGLAISRGRATVGEPLPNIEDPRAPLRHGGKANPAGFACVAPAWLPRRSFAGTYDETWQTQNAPYLPNDFDARYFNCASEGLVFDRHLVGGEPITLMGMSPRGTLHSVIPRAVLATTFVLAGVRHARPNVLQTVLIEPDEERMRLTFHTEFPCDKRLLQVEALEISLQSLHCEQGASR